MLYLDQLFLPSINLVNSIKPHSQALDRQLLSSIEMVFTYLFSVALFSYIGFFNFVLTFFTGCLFQKHSITLSIFRCAVDEQEEES